MTILDLLPFLRGWAHDPVMGKATLRRGVEHPIYHKSFTEGWITGALFVSNSPDVEFEVYVKEKTFGFEKRLTVNLLYLYSMGIVNPNNIWPWISVYDTVANNYRVVYAPARPWSFSGEVKVTALLPETATATTANVAYIINQVLIVNKAEFLRSLRSLIWGRWAPIFDLIEFLPLHRKLEAWLRR